MIILLKKKFNIEISLSEFLIFFNNSLNAVTQRIPNHIKDLDDEEEINEINRNIIKSMSQKIKNETNICKNDYLLLINNIKVEKDNIKELYNNHKKNYNIPCRFIKFINSELVEIVMDINFKNMLVKDCIYKCNANLLNIVDDFGYEYYLKVNENYNENMFKESLDEIDLDSD